MLGFFFHEKWNWDDLFLLPQGAKGDPGLSPGQAMKGEQVRESLLTALISPDVFWWSPEFSELFCFILLLLPSSTEAQSMCWLIKVFFSLLNSFHISLSFFFTPFFLYLLAIFFFFLEYCRLIMFFPCRVREEHQVPQALKVFQVQW